MNKLKKTTDKDESLVKAYLRQSRNDGYLKLSKL